MTYKMMHRPIIIFALLLVVAGCKYGEDFKTYNFRTNEGSWAIDYPPYMRVTRMVYPGAEFQATNGFRDTNAFARRLRTANDAGPMMDSLSILLTEKLENPHIDSDSTYQINETTFHTRRITGKLKNKQIYYLTSVIDDGQRLFHFSGWMFDTKRNIWGEDFEQMLHSWRP